MEKMGYVVGTGLGPQGEGRVEPVTAYVYPQGVSLGKLQKHPKSNYSIQITSNLYLTFGYMHV